MIDFRNAHEETNPREQEEANPCEAANSLEEIKEVNPKRRPTRGRSQVENTVTIERKGLGSSAAGQSGDIEGLSGAASADSESVKELAEEGQSFEAEVISGVEGAPDPDESEVTTHEVSEDDVPSEYDRES